MLRTKEKQNREGNVREENYSFYDYVIRQCAGHAL
jgi:hypothetical protein